MRKSIFIFSLVFAMIMTFVPVSGANGDAEFSIQYTAAGITAGEKLDVSVAIADNPGFCAIQFTLTYDSEKLECTNARAAGILENALTAANPKTSSGAIVSAASVDVIEGDGVVAKYKFTAKEDIAEINFVLKDITLSDINGDSINYSVVGMTEDENDTPAPEDTPDYEGGSGDESGDEFTDIYYPEVEQEDDVYIPETEETETELMEKEEPEQESETTEDEQVVYEHLFADVTGHWAESYINAAAKEGLFKGDDNGNFYPDDNVTRAQFVTVLWRMAGSPSVNEETPFADIGNQIPEFKSAIAWGYSNGYINGTSDTTFDPSGTLTREAGMKILHYYSGNNIGSEMMLTAIYDGTFEDSDDISQWAKNSMYWGIYNKLISGTGETTLSPKGTATRAQLAKILVNYLNTYTN